SRYVYDTVETILETEFQTSSWLNIRKVTAQRAENNQKNYKKDNFYIISIEIVFIYLSWTFLSQPFFNNLIVSV
ncbi:hypothetical protein, partial [Staphylococcus warneri]|uniref:hypothetical protein n=1 Tax=Staphylococcus warneri TaxID=1292 RepID=UPI00119D3230